MSQKHIATLPKRLVKNVKLGEKFISLSKNCRNKKIELRTGEDLSIFIKNNDKLDLEAVLSGEGASLRIFGRFWGKEKDSQDINIRVVQKAPHTSCLIDFKSVLSDASRSFFDGLIRMEEGAVGARGKLSYKALILSDAARVRPIPRLEVLTKSVVSAGHEASVGKIDQNQLFYLQSRGILRQEAEKLIIEGFLGTLCPL